MLHKEEEAFAKVAESCLPVSEKRVQSVQYFSAFLNFFLVVFFFFLGVVVFRVGFSYARDVPDLDACVDRIFYFFNRGELLVGLIISRIEPALNIYGFYLRVFPCAIIRVVNAVVIHKLCLGEIL